MHDDSVMGYIPKVCVNTFFLNVLRPVVSGEGGSGARCGGLRSGQGPESAWMAYFTRRRPVRTLPSAMVRRTR